MTTPKEFLRVVRPCAHCPFVEANNFPLRKSRRKEIAESLRSGTTFFCHSTVDYTDEGADMSSSSGRCVGAASVLYRSGLPPMQNEQIIYRLRLAECNTSVLDRDDTFPTLEDFEEGPN